jgi:hypothetical protein
MAKQGGPVQQIPKRAPGTAERAVKTPDRALQPIADLLNPCLAPDDLIDQRLGHQDLLWVCGPLWRLAALLIGDYIALEHYKR